MQHREFDPPGDLRDAIKCFWYTRFDFGEREARFEVVPDGYAEIIFYFGSVCQIATGGGLQPLPSPFLMGLLGQPVLLHSRNTLEVIGVRCYPWTVFDLLGLPSGKDGLRVFEHPIARLQSALSGEIEAGRVEEAIAQVQRYFLDVPAPTAPDDTLFQAGTALRDAGGMLPVSQVAAAAHATVRTLERKFKQSSGYSVKEVSGLMRFEQVRNRLWRHPDSNLADLARETGYTDQSHLSREFKRYSGTTPAAFARNARKRKQAFRDDFVAFVQS